MRGDVAQNHHFGCLNEGVISNDMLIQLGIWAWNLHLNIAFLCLLYTTNLAA